MLILIVSLKILLKISLLWVNILKAKESRILFGNIQKKKILLNKSLVLLLKYIYLIFLQNKVFKELFMINQNSFTHELYSILAVNTLSLV